MTDTEKEYDEAFDKMDYYNQVAIGIDDALTAIHELGDKSFEVKLLIEQRDYARDREKEFSDIMDKCVRLERKVGKAGIGFYD